MEGRVSKTKTEGWDAGKYYGSKSGVDCDRLEVGWMCENLFFYQRQLTCQGPMLHKCPTPCKSFMQRNSNF